MTHEIDLREDIGEILLTEEQIQGKVRELGARISADYRGRRLTLVSVLKGSLPFMADLMRAIDIPVRIDLMEVSSYGGTATESSGLVRILKDLSASIADEKTCCQLSFFSSLPALMARSQIARSSTDDISTPAASPPNVIA